MTQQALELRVEIFVVANAFDIMLLRHPLDPEDDERNAERAMGQNSFSDFLRRPNRFAVRHKAGLELLCKLPEQMNVLRFFTRELQQRARAIVVFVQMRACVIEHERQNKLLDDAESVEIAEAAYLIEQDFFLDAEKFERLYARQRFGHERLGEIEALVAADDVFDSPVHLY